jgi:succinate-semialdehyde dehydrogenase/glutarate-semialdehyde dehydrogenase
MPEDIQKVDSKFTTALNPATGEIIGYSPLNSIDDLKSQIHRARLAQKEWSALSIIQRAKHIKKTGTYIYDNADRLSRLISEENGKTQMDAFSSEIYPSVMAVDYYCKMAKKFIGDKKISASNIFFLYKSCKIRQVPWGVIGVISPWNYPFAIPFYEVIMGLLAGNSVILKTSSESQLVGRAIKETIDSADLPDGLFNLINIPGRMAGDAFLENGIDKLFFTGSVRVGKKLMAKAAESLTPLSLELGGNDPMIICEDANLERAAAGALWAGFQNCGQSCGGIERVYVQETVYEPFLKILKNRIQALRLGLGTDFDTDIGAMTTTSQIELVKAHIKDALEKGAEIHAESPLPANNNLKNFLPAAVLTGVDHTMDIMREETFGPVVGVMKFGRIEEAINLANDSSLGLTGSVWSRDRQKAEKIGRQLQAGVITINDHLMTHGMPATPWGGFKESSIGRGHGEIGFKEMTQTQVVVQDLLHFAKRNPWWHPYSKKEYLGIKGNMQALYSKNLWHRISGLINFIKIVPAMFSVDSKRSDNSEKK